MRDRDDAAKILPLVARRDEQGRELVRTGWLVPGDRLRVDFPGNAREPVAARVLEGLDRAALREAAAGQREVLLVFAEGQPDRPVIVGVLAPAEPILRGLEAPETPEVADLVEVDGRRIELRGHDEIVLRCGQASITLRRNGRLVLRGTHVESSSEGVNRVRGGSVQLN